MDLQAAPLLTDLSPSLNFGSLNNSVALLHGSGSFDSGLTASLINQTALSLPSISPRGGINEEGEILTKETIERSLADIRLKKHLRAQGLYINDTMEIDPMQSYANDSLPSLTERKPSVNASGGGEKIY